MFAHAQATYSHPDCQRLYGQSMVLPYQHSFPSTEWAMLKDAFWGKVSSHNSLIENKTVKLQIPMVSLFFSPLLPVSDATSEETWRTSADYKAPYTGS